MAQMSMQMGQSMNNFAQQMNHGMNQMAFGLTDMFNNMAASFGPWNVPNVPNIVNINSQLPGNQHGAVNINSQLQGNQHGAVNINSQFPGNPHGVVNINSQLPGNQHSVVNINSNIGSYEAPVVQSPMNFQTFGMHMPAFPSVMNVNSQIHTQNNIPKPQQTLHNSYPVSSSSVVKMNNKVFQQNNNNAPHVLNIDTHIQNKNGKTQGSQNVNINMGNSFGAFNGQAFAAGINNHIANVFSKYKTALFFF